MVDLHTGRSASDEIEDITTALIKLDELILQLKINNAHLAIINNEIITEDDIED